MITHVPSTRNAAAEMQSQSQCSVESLREGGREREEARDPLEHWRDGREQCSTCRKREGEKGTEESGLHKGRTTTDVVGCLMERALARRDRCATLIRSASRTLERKKGNGPGRKRTQ